MISVYHINLLSYMMTLTGNHAPFFRERDWPGDYQLLVPTECLECSVCMNAWEISKPQHCTLSINFYYNCEY